MREYKSFKEIDRDLKILKLQRDIDMEEIKLSIDETKESINPLASTVNTVGSLFKNVLLFKAVSKIFTSRR